MAMSQLTPNPNETDKDNHPGIAWPDMAPTVYNPNTSRSRRVKYAFLESNNRKDLVLVRHLLSKRPYSKQNMDNINKGRDWDDVAHALQEEIDPANGKPVFGDQIQIRGKDVQLRFHAYMRFAKQQMLDKQSSKDDSQLPQATNGETEILRGIIDIYQEWAQIEPKEGMLMGEKDVPVTNDKPYAAKTTMDELTTSSNAKVDEIDLSIEDSTTYSESSASLPMITTGYDTPNRPGFAKPANSCADSPMMSTITMDPCINRACRNNPKRIYFGESMLWRKPTSFDRK